MKNILILIVFIGFVASIGSTLKTPPKSNVNAVQVFCADLCK